MAIQDKALDGCTALVTGGSRGIGRAICVALGARGAKVAINYHSREDAARETAELVQRAGGTAVLAAFDHAEKGEDEQAREQEDGDGHQQGPGAQVEGIAEDRQEQGQQAAEGSEQDVLHAQAHAHGAATLPRDLLRRPTLLGLPGGSFSLNGQAGTDA